MQFLFQILSSSEGMFLYEIISLCIGLILIIDVKTKQIWYTVSVYSICFANGFLWGSMILFQIFYNKVSFLGGGLLGILLTLSLCIFRKNIEKYLICFWCLVKAFLILGNYALEHYSEGQEERIFALAFTASIIIAVVLLAAACIHKLRRKEWVDVNKFYKFFGLFYGSFLVTGCMYEFIYDVATRETKFLYYKTDYINFYKALLKIDWTEDGTGIFFGGICFVLIMVGLIRQWKVKSKEYDGTVTGS